MSMRSWSWGALSVLSLAVIAKSTAGCGQSNTQGFGDDGGAGGEGGSADDGGDDVIGFGDDGGEGGQQLGCSPDLQSVIDGQGNVVQKCPDDQGCDAGQCVPACQAAGDSHGNVGCDFVVSTPSFYATIAPPCFAVFLANNWPHNAKITVTRAGQSYNVTQFGKIPNGTPNEAQWQAVPSSGLPSQQVAVLFLSHDPASVNGQPVTCPVPPAISQAGGSAVWMQQDSTGRGKAFHIVTDIPVSAYDILPYGGAHTYLPSAELVLPTTAWDTNYVAVLPRPTSGPPWGQIVAAQDNTDVKIVPTVALPGGNGVNAAPQNQVTSYSLNANEYIQWQPSGEMTGTVIQSTKPIVFAGGTGYLCMGSQTSSGGGCDSQHQIIPPVRALGHEYAVAPYATRRADMSEESIPYRFVGAVKGTTLKFDPPVAGAPTSLDVGQLAEFEATGPFVVTSQDDKHPFYVGQHMSGCEVTGGSRGYCSGGGFGCCLGDEDYVNVLPPAQWLSKYVFFTDPTYPTTNLVVVRLKTASGFHDVKVDCVGTLTGWKPVAGGSQYERTDVDLVRGTPNGSCTNGGHVASSDGPFGMTVWGLDTYSSYSYPAGGNVAPINQVVVPPTPK